MTKHIARTLGIGLLLSLIQLSAADAAESKLVRDARKFTAANGLRPRLVEAGNGQMRLVVPVTPGTADAFAQTFGGANGYVRLREGHYRNLGTFLFLSVGPNQIYHHRASEYSPEGRLFDPPCSTAGSHYRQNSRIVQDPVASAFYSSAPSFCMPVKLSPRELRHMTQWLERAPTDPQVNREWSNCMHFTGNAETAPGRTLFDALGIRRSKDGPNMIAKVCHGGNCRIGVVARYVQSQAQFDAISDADLLGPLPFGGVQAAIKTPASANP